MVRIRQLPNYDSCTINRDFGLGVVLQRNNSDKLEDNIDQLSWENYMQHRHKWLRIMEPSEFYDFLSI